MHCVAVTQRLMRSRLLVPTQPGQKQVQQFRALVAAEPAVQEVVAPRKPVKLPKWSRFVKDPEVMLDWLEASRHIRHAKKSGDACKSFAQILARAHGTSANALMSTVPSASSWLLRSGRARLDMVAMLVWRQFWLHTLAAGADNNHVYLFCDASPKAGSEIFAATMDVYDGEEFRRWQLPCVALRPGMLDHVGKSLALVWHLFLVTGPNPEHVRAFCSKVRSITTDMGTERLIVAQP